jgi:hypothetical protein
MQCGHKRGAMPCPSYPHCKGRLISSIDDVQLEVCEACGGQGEPPCGKISPCDKGLAPTTIRTEDSIRILAQGQELVCSSEPVHKKCGFAGFDSCSGQCFDRSTATEDGQRCVMCGGEGEGTCDGHSQKKCNEGLMEKQDPGRAPVCTCPQGPGRCGGVGSSLDMTQKVPTSEVQKGDAVSTPGKGQPGNNTASLGTNNTSSPAEANATSTGSSDADCGQKGKRLCAKRPFCGDRLIPEETGMCVALVQHRVEHAR